MKKHYKKPVMTVENFALSTHIAACTLTANQADGLTCTYTTGGDVIFDDGNGACVFDVDMYEQYCYNTPTGGGIFGS